MCGFHIGAGGSTTPESVGYSLKRLVLGKPLITEQLKSERLSNPVALGVLSPDAISSSAYGTEEILIELLPYAGLAAFTLVLPITGVILVILVLVALVASLYGCGLPERSAMRDQTAYVAFAAAAVAAGVAVVFNRTGRNR